VTKGFLDTASAERGPHFAEYSYMVSSNKGRLVYESSFLAQPIAVMLYTGETFSDCCRLSNGMLSKITKPFTRPHVPRPDHTVYFNQKRRL
jgi:hypothetical protein